MASRRGAAAALMRSVTARSLRTLHAGMTLFADGAKPLPCAAITTEDADYLARLAASGETIRMTLTLGAKLLGDVDSANVVGELVGREKPDEIVVLAAHLDSWDVGHGAHDDGAGVVVMMEALTTLRKLGLTPRRTIRVVLYTNEENGISGATAYPRAHADELAKHVAALESDSGGFAPVGFSVTGGEGAVPMLADVASLLAPIQATQVEAGFGGVDIMTLGPAGVPQLGLRVEGSRYFDYHHTEADTLDKVDPEDLKKCVAASAIMAYVLAEMDGALPRVPPPPPAAP
jgi:Zn-dependent M28 family amino/carboxypeptidase